MTYKEKDKIVAKLRELADFIEDHGVELPDFYYTPTLNVYLTATEYVEGENGEYETKILEDETKENLRKFLHAVGSCEKKYSDDKIEAWRMFESVPNTVMIRGVIDRSVACKRVVTGQKMVQAQLIPAKMEDEVEWVCDEGISLLKLVQ